MNRITKAFANFFSWSAKSFSTPLSTKLGFEGRTISFRTLGEGVARVEKVLYEKILIFKENLLPSFHFSPRRLTSLFLPP